MKIGVIVLSLTLFSYLVGYFMSANSDAFIEARRFITESPTVNRELGNNISVQLAPFGYELEFAGSWGVATFDCGVKGSKGKGRVQIVLNKAGKIWQVKTATLNANGRNVAL